MAIASSKRLGWIALGIYIQRMNIPAATNPFYKTIIDYHRAMSDSYHMIETTMTWADDYRMVMFPNELIQRLEAIDNEWDSYLVKKKRKLFIRRRAERARLELTEAWSN